MSEKKMIYKGPEPEQWNSATGQSEPVGLHLMMPDGESRVLHLNDEVGYDELGGAAFFDGRPDFEPKPAAHRSKKGASS